MSDLGERGLNHLVMLAGHFARPVRIEGYEEIASGIFHLRVRHPSGAPDETQVTAAELEASLAVSASQEKQLVAPQDLFLWVESQRIRGAGTSPARPQPVAALPAGDRQHRLREAG